jgi:hypothetical protein
MGDGAGELEVLDHGDVVLGNDGGDALGLFVVAFGEDDGGRHHRSTESSDQPRLMRAPT